MKITILGTGTSQGVPVIGCRCEVCQSLDFRDKRLRASVKVELEGKTIVVDTGPDFRQQMLGAPPETLDAILFTHQHKDHTAGLDDTRPFYFKQKGEIKLYATEAVAEQLQQEYAYAFAKEKYPGAPGFNLQLLDGEPFMLFGERVTPIKVMHGNLPVLGFRVNRFAYVTDANHIPNKELEKLRGVEVLVLDALQQRKHHSHFTLVEAITVAKEVGAKKTYFTHVSHNMGLHREVNNQLPSNMELAYDGLQIEL